MDYRNKPDEYYMYLRKSRADIELEKVEKFETLAKHEKLLKNLAKKQGLNVTKIYRELVSGESISERPEMQNLLSQVMQNKCKGVLVVEIERLARGDTKDQGEVAETFKMSNTLIVTPSKTFDPQNEFDEEYFEFNLFMSRREYKTIRRRMRAGLLSSINEGNYMGSLAPYGYDIIRIDKKTRTLKENDQSKYVVMIFEMFVKDRLNVGEIARRLTQMNILTQTGKVEWNRATIKDILKNDLYTGKIRWNRRKVAKEFDNDTLLKKKTRRDRKDYILVDGKHPAIISQETFNKAQTLFVGAVPIKAMSTITNPYAGLIKCSNCGRNMIYNVFNTKNNTVPRLIHRESSICKMKSVPMSQVTEALIYSLNNIIGDFEFKTSNAYEVEQTYKHDEFIKELEKALEDAKEQRSNLFELLERKLYNENEFLERKTVLTARIEELEANIKKEELNAPTISNYQEEIHKLSSIIEMLKSDTLEAKQKNIMLKEIIDHIDFTSTDLGRQKGATISLDVYLK